MNSLWQCHHQGPALPLLLFNFRKSKEIHPAPPCLDGHQKLLGSRMGHWPWNSQSRMVTAPFSPELRGFLKCKITISSPISGYKRIKPGLGLSSTHNNKWIFTWAAKGEDKQALTDLGAVRLWKHVHILQGIKITWNHSRTHPHAQTDTHTQVFVLLHRAFSRQKSYQMGPEWLQWF